MQRRLQRQVAGRGFLLEWYWPGVDEEQASTFAAALGSPSYRGGLLVPGDETLLLYFEGPDAQALRCDRISPAVLLGSR